MDNIVYYSSKEAYEKAMREKGVILPSEQDLANPDVPLSEAETQGEELTDDQKGEIIATAVRLHGIVPTFEESKLYRKYTEKQQVDAWNAVGGAIGHTLETLAEGGYELVKDTLTGKLHKVAGSAVEGVALGTKNWLYMYEEAKFDENSWLHKMLFDTHSNDQDYYWNLKQSIETQKMIKKDAEEGILLPPKINIGGMELDLTNPTTVQAVSFVADISWLAPNVGIESTIAKGLRGASKIIGLGEQLSKASAYAYGKLAKASGSLADSASKVAGVIETTERRIINGLKDVSGVDVELAQGGRLLYDKTLLRGAVDPLGGNDARIPAWGLTQAVWGVAKLSEAVANTSKLAFELAGKQSEIAGMRLSERIAMASENKTVQNLSTTWSKVASPFLEYAKGATKTSLHSAMYGGAFGVVFGGEEGFYNGLGTGFALGGAFHHIGLIHGAVAGSKAIPDTVKNFLWATSHMDYFNQEGIVHFLNEAEKTGGVQARLRAMADIASIERLGRSDRRVYLREERIKQMLRDNPESWAEYEKLLSNPDWGGVAFHKDSTGENYTIVNTDRTSLSGPREEFFHTMLLGRYAEAFKKAGVDALIGTADEKGALFTMPKEEAVRLVEAFRDSYLKLESTTKQGSLTEHQQALKNDFDLAIAQIKKGEHSEILRSSFEEFLASYWNRFIEEKPIDYLLNGGDLGIVRNTIEWAKSTYRDVMYKDLTSAGASFKWGEHPDNFFIEQNTKQRIRIPQLEKLMKHYVKEVSKERYSGWKKNATQHSEVGLAITSGFGHLFTTENAQASLIGGTKEYEESHSTAVLSAIDEIATTVPKEERGLIFSVVGGHDTQEQFRFSPAKNKSKKAPKEEVGEKLAREEAEKQIRALRQRSEKLRKELESNVSDEEISNMEDELGAETEAGESTGFGWRTVVGKDGFWRSEWEGKARIKITGKAGNAELKILSKYLPQKVVQRFADLNTVIEVSKFTSNNKLSNVLTSQVMTVTRMGEDGKREKAGKGKFFVDNRTFVPIEISMTFDRVKDGVEDGMQNWAVGNAKLTVLTLDMDALSTRIDFAWNSLKEKEGINYKRVRTLFSSKQNLEHDIRRLLENYSKGQKAEAGAEFFRGEENSIREARDKRDIVNAIIGFHPTKAMLKGGSKAIEKAGGHYQLRLQRRDVTAELNLPNVVKSFRIDRIGTIRQLPLEGFTYNHDNAYVRGQFNFSPSKINRDHEGNNIHSGIVHTLMDSVYRNKEGELMAVYGLDKHNAVRKVNPLENVHTYVDDELGSMFDRVNPFSRGNAYETDSGWLHFTPDGAEAGIHTDSRLITGYIDTQRHIDITQLDANSTIKDVVDKLSERIAKLTKTNVNVVKEELFKVETVSGTIGDLYNLTGDKVWSNPSMSLENWLFTKETIPYFTRKGIHSIEYNSINLLNGNEFSSIAIFNGDKFIENRSRANEAQNFAFSPSKPLVDKLQETIRKAGGAGNAFLDYVINEKGEFVPNLRKITKNDVERIIETELTSLLSIQERIKKNHPFSTSERQKYIELLTPYVYSSLRKEFPFAPKKVLDQITKLSLEGYKIDRVQGKGIGQRLILRDSVFIREAKRYGITGERIRKTGIPSLGHWAEMTEKEFAMFKIHKQVEDITKNQGKKGIPNLDVFLNRPENKEYLEGIRKYNGWAGFMAELGNRGRDLIFITDNNITYKKSSEVSAGLPTILDSRKIKDYFAIKTQAFVEQTLKTQKMNLKQRSALLGIKKGYEDILSAKLVESIGDNQSSFNIQISDARNLYESYRNTITDIISEEAQNRINDMLTAYHIENADAETIKKVRTSLYDLANRGLITLGTPEAVQKAVEIYASLSSDNAKNVIDIQKAINRNYVTALQSMEQKGFFGTMWREHSQGVHIYPNGVIISGERMWKWDGTGYYVIERSATEAMKSKLPEIVESEKLLFQRDRTKEIKERLSNQKVLELYDQKGNLVHTYTYDLEVPIGNTGKKVGIEKPEVDLIVKEFLRMSAKALDSNTYAQSIFSPHFVVEGDSKNFIINTVLQDIREFYPDILIRLKNYAESTAETSKKESVEKLETPEGEKTLSLIDDTSMYDLYQKDGVYLLIRRNDKVDADNSVYERNHKIKITGNNFKVISQITKKSGNLVVDKIKSIEEILKKDSVGNRKLSDNEKIYLLEQLAEFKRIQYLDTGIVFHFDDKMNVVIPDEGKNLQTIEERTKALKKLQNKGWDQSLFMEEVKSLYEQFQKHLEKKVIPKNNERIARVLSKSEGNIAKIRQLESELQKVESEYRKKVRDLTNEENRKRSEQNKDLEKGKRIAPITAIEIIAKIEAEKKNAKQRLKDQQDKRAVIRQRLIEIKQLEGWLSLSEDEQGQHYSDFLEAESRGAVTKNGLERPSGIPQQSYVFNLKEKLAQVEQDIIQTRLQVDSYERSTDTRKKKEAEIKAKIAFLVDQLARAKGQKFTRQQLEEFVDKKLFSLEDAGDGLVKSVVRYKKLAEVGTKKNSLPTYIPDLEGLTTKNGRPEVIDTVDKYYESFKHGIMQLRDRWFNANNKEHLTLASIVSEGRDYLNASPDIEVPYSLKARKVINDGFFSAKDLEWIASPSNFKIVQSLEQRWKLNELSDGEFVDAIKEAVSLSGLDKNGVKLLSAEKRLRDTITDISNVITEIRKINGTSDKFINTDIFSINEKQKLVPQIYEKTELTQRHIELYEQWQQLIKRKKALEERIKKIEGLADSPESSQEFKDLIADRALRKRNLETIERNIKESEDMVSQWRQQWRDASEKLFERYDDVARRVGFDSSRIRVRASDLTAHPLLLGLPSITHDLFPNSPELWWGHTFEGDIGANSGFYAKGELGFFEKGSNPAKDVSYSETQQGKWREVYLADYIARVEQWMDYHLDPKNEFKPMTAEQAIAQESFYPELTQHPVVINKKKGIPNEKIQRIYDIVDGIRDIFKSDTEKEQFIKAFVGSGIELIYGDAVMKENAYKQLKGLSDKQFDELRASMDPKEFQQMLNSKEIFERVLYLVAKQHNNRIPLRKSSPLNRKLNKDSTLSSKPFLTSKYGLPLTTLIKMDGFGKIWDESTKKLGSVFDMVPATKKAYEKIDIEKRFMLETSSLNQILLQNEAGMMQRQREDALNRQRQGKPYWGETFRPEIESELVRVNAYISTVMSVESSLRRFKGDVQGFIKNRPKALFELLSKKDSPLAFPELDFTNPDLGNWRESNDGRYIIKKDGDSKYRVYFVGESVHNGKRQKLMDIPTMEIGIVSDVTQAQVLVRFFNDDISRAHHSALLIEGGTGQEPWNVAGTEIPSINTEGKVMPEIPYIGDFSREIISLYEMNKGHPRFKEEMIKHFQAIGQYGEPQWVGFSDNGQIKHTQLTITPLAEVEMEKTHTRGVNNKGEVIWTPKPETKLPNVDDVNNTNTADTVTPDNPEPSKADEQLKNISVFDIISNFPAPENNIFPEWNTIRNKLNYTIIKIKVDKKTNAYRLFNPASGFMGAFFDEQEAVNEILKAEKAKQGNKQ